MTTGFSVVSIYVIRSSFPDGSGCAFRMCVSLLMSETLNRQESVSSGGLAKIPLKYDQGPRTEGPGAS